jgi:molybdopterin-biosynthesis enzyme MoeA-like protein
MLRLDGSAAIAVVPDGIQLIADEVFYCAPTFDFVVTSGGVGPTHDITVEAVASFVRNSAWPETA